MKRLLLAGLATAAVLGATGGVAATPTPYGTWTDHLSLNEIYDRGFDPRMRGTYKLVLAKNGTYKWFHALSRRLGRRNVHGVGAADRPRRRHRLRPGGVHEEGVLPLGDHWREARVQGHPG